MRYGEAGKHLSDEDIVAEEGDGLGKNEVIVVESGVNDPFVQNRVCQDVDQKDLSLGDGEIEKVDGDFIGGGAQD